MKTKDIIISLLVLALIYTYLFISIDKALDIELKYDDSVVASYK